MALFAIGDITKLNLMVPLLIFAFSRGNHFSGKPIAKVTVTGDKGAHSFNIIGNGHTGEWNQNQIKPKPGTSIHNGAKTFTTYENRVHVARFSFPKMKVTRIKIDLLSAAKWGSKHGVFAVYGGTLVNE